ncbi:MAG: hypothetical protein JXJ17_06945 [Anaerolineae bacterium]|nr:hypothetical protein [Anaerolineae bacterium]
MRRNTQLIAILIILFLAGCVEDSPAPGCAKGFGMGGCFGKTIITGIQVEPEMDCLEIDANNCNGGVLDVRNTCEGTFVLDGNEIGPGDSATFDIEIMLDGSYRLVEGDSNFSALEVSEDLPVSFSGSLDGQQVEIRYTRTAPLCE